MKQYAIGRNNVPLIFGGNLLGVNVTPVDPYNPLGLPPNTVRIQSSDGHPPNAPQASYDTATLVAGTSDIYDIYRSGTSFAYLLYYATNVRTVLGANTTGITNMSHMFDTCSDLAVVPLFDTSSVTTTEAMFYHCGDLMSIPLFDTSSVVNMDQMFDSCRMVESGALALYQQASSQATPPSYHRLTFYDCGANTVTGREELAQIPSGWKY